MSFLVLVPTMWNYPPFRGFIEDILHHKLVAKLVVVDNDPTINNLSTSVLQNNKLIYKTLGHNIGVNPAWNMAASIAESEGIDWICLLNDDLIFDMKLFVKVLELYERDRNIGILGLQPGFAIHDDLSLRAIEGQTGCPNGLIDFIRYEGRHQNTFGFGTLMLFRRQTFIPIPNDLIIYFGDDWLLRTHEARKYNNYLITNLLHFTPQAMTTGKIPNCQEIINKEELIYYKYLCDFLQSLGGK